MEWLTTALSTCTGFFTTVLGLITDTPVLAIIFVGGTIVPLAFRIFRNAKRSA